MAEIMGTVTSVKRYLSPEKIELKISPDLGGESTIILQQNRKYIIPDFQREIRWEENNLSICCQTCLPALGSLEILF